ncbi:MAG TPA: hypothetical protein VK669_10255 [Candidatus Limnocylindrales bacterium]|nr:hypothetical protein [Candidatus Limnocylindrales bacterium]
MRQFVRRDVEKAREAVEHFPVAVAIDHLRAVPRRVLIALAEVNARDHVHSAIVDRVALEHRRVELKRLSRHVVCPVGVLVAAAALALCPHESPGKRPGPFGIVDQPPSRMRPRRDAFRRRDRLPFRPNDRRASPLGRTADAPARMPFQRLDELRRNNCHRCTPYGVGGRLIPICSTSLAKTRSAALVGQLVLAFETATLLA